MGKFVPKMKEVDQSMQKRRYPSRPRERIMINDQSSNSKVYELKKPPVHRNIKTAPKGSK